LAELWSPPLRNIFILDRELESTTEEYKLLEQMNRITTTKYADMRQITTNISKVWQILIQILRCLVNYVLQKH
jgi:thermostable 8-oxoguanine DNA glycosylase